MQTHFSSFTPEAMRALGQELATAHQQRREFLGNIRDQMSAFLEEAEVQRRKRAKREANGRKIFMSELQSGVHALRERSQLTRREMAKDLRRMAVEVRAASEAWRGRPGGEAGFSSRRGARIEDKEGTKGKGHSKTHHAKG
ncbi:MAG: hypothetical protein HY897_00975 [Deltaproteobacteria bacterium]|nr:hypothetical protein [Deltaproteobacteria bacterium]